MWTCNLCQSINNVNDGICPNCGHPRDAQAPTAGTSPSPYVQPYGAPDPDSGQGAVGAPTTFTDQPGYPPQYRQPGYGPDNPYAAYGAPGPYAQYYPAAQNRSSGSYLAIRLVVALAAFILSFAAADLLSTTKKEIRSGDGRYSLKIPMAWQMASTTRLPSLVEYMQGGRGVMIISVSRHRPRPYELDDQTWRIEGITLRSKQYTLVAQPVTLTVAGYPACQFVVDHARTDAFRSYVHRLRKTLIATPDGIYDVTVYTHPEDQEADRADQDAILASFRPINTTIP